MLTDRFQAHLDDGLPYELIHRVVRPDGQIRWVLERCQTEFKDGKAIRSLGTVTDFSQIFEQKAEISKERKRAEENETFFETIFENIPQMVFVKDAINLRFLRFNRAGEMLLGYNRESLIGKNDYDFFPEQEADFFTNKDRQILAKDGPSNPIEEEITSKNGTRYLRTKKIALRDESGKAKYLLGISEDISEAKRIQDELLREKNRAEQNENLKTAFLHNLSHEIRTPMNAILGFSKLLGFQNQDKEKQEKYKSYIISNANRLMKIVEDVLTISSIDTEQEQLNLKFVNLREILKETLNSFTKLAEERNVELQISQIIPTTSEIVEVDEYKIRKVLSCLLENAIIYAPHASVELKCSFENSNLYFQVIDSGIGIDIEEHEKIFQRFVRLNSSAENDTPGTGLGLSIAEGLVKLMHGEIWLDSEIDQGSTFHFKIPIRKKEIGNLKHEEKELENLDDIKKVLVVEDEATNFHLISELLSDLPIEILHAEDGLKALDMAKENPDIKLVLMDIKLPKMDGVEATKRIRKLLPHVYVVAQTAFSLVHEIEQYQNNFDEYITKPYEEELLLSKVKEFLLR